MYGDSNCHDKLSYSTHAVYLPIYNASSWEPVFFNDLSDINALIEKLLNQLPGPRELTDNDFTVSNISKCLFIQTSFFKFYFQNFRSIICRSSRKLNPMLLGLYVFISVIP